MILKKPYAFLIKYFRIIHLVLLAMILFITYRFNKIVKFFSEYVINNKIVNEYTVGNYIPITIFIAVLIVIIFSILMWLLMNQKKKPNKFYLLTGIYYLIILIATIYAYNVINSLTLATLPQRVSLAYRDIYQILFIPNIYFIIISLIRAIGFDVKKFNFSKDLEELEINSKDNEEFEFVLGNNNYKYKRRFRRILREFKYYIIENKVFIGIILALLIIVGAAAFILNVNFINKTYKVGDTLKANNFIFKLNNAYITQNDLTNKKIKTGKKYLILNFTIKGNTLSKALNPEDIYLKAEENTILYKTTLTNSFSDFGTVYRGEKLGNNEYNYIFVYELDENQKDKYTLNIFDKIKYKNNSADYIYQVYKITPKNIDNEVTEHSGNLNEKIVINKDFYGTSTITIKDIKIINSYEYQKSSCDSNNENCTTYIDILLPNDNLKNDLLKVEYELNFDQDYSINKKQFFDKYLKIKYTIDESTNTVGTVIKTIENNDELVFGELSKNISNANSIDIIISTRTNNIIYKIK